MTVAIVVLLAVLVVLHALIVVAVYRPLMGLGRIADALAGLVEAFETVAGRMAEPTAGDVIRNAGAAMADTLRAARDE